MLFSWLQPPPAGKSIAHDAARPRALPRCTVRLGLLLFLAMAPAALAEAPAASLTVTFKGLKSQTGMVMLSLAGSPEAFDGKGSATAQAGVAPAGGTVSITFAPLKPGTYAVRAFHDVNGDGKLNTNPFGMPLEPYAFSNDARGALGPPKWAQAAFEVKAGENRQTIDID